MTKTKTKKQKGCKLITVKRSSGAKTKMCLCQRKGPRISKLSQCGVRRKPKRG